MSTSPRMRWPYPAEGVDPWYDAFQDMVRAQDATALALHDQKNIILTGGGDISWNASTGVVSWTLPITLNSSQSGFIESVPAGSLYVPDDGQYGYVRFVPSPQDNVELVLRAADVLPASDVDRTYILFRRRQNKLYWRNGGVLSSGETAAIIDDGPGGGGGGGAVVEVTASAPLTVTGSITNPNIEFSGWPSNSTGVLTNDGSGNLSWETDGGGTISGSLSHTQIAFGAPAPNQIEGSHDFAWLDADKVLYVNGLVGLGLTDPNEILTVGGRLSLATQSIPAGIPSVEGTVGFGKLIAGDDGRPYWIDPDGLVLNLTLDRFTDLGTTAVIVLDADPAKPVFNSVTLNGDATFSTDNLGAGRSVSARVVNSGAVRTLTFPVGWTWLGSGAPPTLDAGKTGYLSLTAYGATDADVIAAWSYEDMPTAVTGSGVATRVAFWDTSSSLSSSSDLYWDNSNSRLGIGTATPSELIHVRRDYDGVTSMVLQNTSAGASASARISVSGESGRFGGIAQFSTGGTFAAGRTAVLGESPDGLTLGAPNATGSINFITGALNNANERVRITAAGAVGIATSTPTTTLSIAEKFQVDSNGNVLKVNNVPTSFPSSQGAANTILRNDGSGNLSWVANVDYRLVDLNTSASLLGHAVVMNTDTVVQDGNAGTFATSLVVGFVKVVGPLGVGKVQTIGIVEGVQFVSGLTLAAGNRVFLSLTNGHLTNTIAGMSTPNVMAEVGIVSDASQYLVDGTASIIFSTKVPVAL